MVDGVINNVFLVNAPAGSGKTTWIRQQVESYISQNPYDNVLCITYTNRAAEELGKDLNSDRVYFGTIHSFINDFISSFFSHDSIIDLYFEIYQKQILERIENVNQQSNWRDANERYEKKYGKLDLNTIRSNIKAISYNQAPFNSLYMGALGHDDLISFTRIVADRFPIIKKKISDKYQVIYLDEYQDASADVLNILYTSVLEKKSKFYLLGDKMQQIYDNYKGEFEKEFKTFNKSVNLSTNYRTTPKIVSILNAIYNNPTLKQHSYEKKSDNEMDFLPNVYIVSDVEKEVVRITELYKDALILYLTNKARFKKIGAGELYEAYSKMRKYQFGRKYGAVDILIKEEIRKNDLLMDFLFMMGNLSKNYKQECYGEVFKNIRTRIKYCNPEKYIIKKHEDKKFVKKRLETLISFYEDSSTTIGSFIDICNKNKFLKNEIYLEIIEDSDYCWIKNVSLCEVSLLAEYLNNPRISTQHGVKGESHDTVVFVSENSNTNPIVHMSKFFELWSSVDINLTEFDDFYYEYKEMIQEIENNINTKCSSLNKNTYSRYSDKIDDIIQSYILKNKSNPYYINLLKGKMDEYHIKKNVTAVKNCLKESSISGILSAYRLFYVGCSRARRNLTIIINKNDIANFEGDLKDKLSSCGFDVK